MTRDVESTAQDIESIIYAPEFRDSILNADSIALDIENQIESPDEHDSTLNDEEIEAALCLASEEIPNN